MQEFFEKKLHKSKDNPPRNLEIGNVNNEQLNHWVILHCVGADIHLKLSSFLFEILHLFIS